MTQSSQSWGNLYQRTLEETDPSKIVERIHAVEAAICERWQELANSPNDHELRAINLAVQGLLMIKTDKLKWPSVDSDQAESSGQSSVTRKRGSAVEDSG